MVTPKRGDIFWVNLDPTRGTEIRKKRPVIVVSNNAANLRYHQVTIVPLTSQQTHQVEPFQVFIDHKESGLSKNSKALAEQIRTVSKLRLSQRIGHVSEEIMEQMAQAIKIHLAL